jgi:prepilin-type N-terminal cleavage/methylation domain-containing protein
MGAQAMKNRSGFTLIEIMVSLVLVGLIAAIAGTSVITGMRGYLFAKENDVITQKAQLALGRINREFMELMDIKAVNNAQPYVIYEVPLRDGGIQRRAIAKVGNEIRMFFGVSGNMLPDQGDVLADGVQSLTIMYNPSSGNPSSWASLWSYGQDIRNLYALSVQLVMARPDTGGEVSFLTTVSPRNNNNAGGATPPTASNPPPEYSGKQCFVTTAAWGDPEHPVVEVLRQFRDRILMRSAAGEAMVRYYYEVGPTLAAAIEDKPLACLMVRLLVMPAAGFAYLALSCPILILPILLLSWGIAHLILGTLKRQYVCVTAFVRGQHGAMLITLIAAMVVFSVLGATMIAMFGTAALSQVSGNNSLRAYYLAESGFRYAAGAYINAANEDARETATAGMHGVPYSLSSGDGAFLLSIYPYYFKKVDSPVPGAPNELVAKVSGGLPNGGNFIPNSWVKITMPDGTVAYEQIAGVVTVSATPNLVKFNKQGGQTWTNYQADSVITPTCIPDRDVNGLRLIGPDGDGRYDLAFKAGTGAQAFPERNGIVMVKFQGETDPRVLSYRQRDIDNSRLKGISDPNGGNLPTGPMVNPETAAPYQNFVELTRFLRVESTGTYGTGSSAVSRKVTYYAPIGYAKAQSAAKTQYHDKMLDLTNWISGNDISSIGMFATGMFGSSLRATGLVTNYMVPGGSCLKFKEFQTGFNWTVAGVPIQQEWWRAGRYLSYDIEVKVLYNFFASPDPAQAYGVTFRLDEQGNALGFSFARGVQAGGSGVCSSDGIPGVFFENISGYQSYTPVLVMWMKEYAKQESSVSVLSSPHLASPAFYDDPPPPGTGTFAIVTTNAFWQNGDRVRLVNAGGVLPSGIAAGKDYYIRKVTYENKTYLYLFDTLANAMNTSAPFWIGLVDITAAGTGSTTIIVQDPVFTKLAHQVLTSENEYYGLISSWGHYMKFWSTFLARLIEAPSISFIGGGGAAGREIFSGDVVYQTLNNQPDGTLTAIARVARSPVYRTSAAGVRNWPGGQAQGILLLEVLKDSGGNIRPFTFTAGSTIFVGDHPAGTDKGTVGVPGGVTDDPFRERNNWILSYVADTSGKSPSDINPFNNYRGPVLRRSAIWPPDNVVDTVPSNDSFTLIRFSGYVNPAHCAGFFTKDNSGSAGDVIRFTSPDPNGNKFYSPRTGTIFPVSRAEVGLHAYGNGGSGAVEYDDFAIQFGPGYQITRRGFLLPIQQ